MAGASFGDLVIGLRADSTQFAADLKKSQRTFSGFVSGVTSGFAKFGLAVGGVRTAFDLLIGPMQEAQEAALAERKLAQVFKSTASAAGVAKDAVMDYAAERQKTTSFDADDTVNAAAILGSFTNVKGDVFMQALTSAQDLSAFMGQDLQTSIIQIGKALNDPAKGVSALAKSGIQFSESQKEQIKVLQDTGRVADAQAMILKELQTQFGGQAEALVDPIAQAKNAWGDFMETIGGIANEKLLPLMPKLIEGIETMADVAVEVFEKVEAIANRIGEFDQTLKDLGGGGVLETFAPGLALGRDMLQGDIDGSKASGGLAGAIAKGTAVDSSSLNALRASVVAGRKGTAADPEITGRLFTPKQEEEGRRMAGHQLAEWVRDGLAGLETGLMSLGPVPESRQEASMNQIGSLEKDSQEAFEVLRANVGAGAKDKIPEKQLKLTEKQNELLAKIYSNTKTNWKQKAELFVGDLD